MFDTLVVAPQNLVSSGGREGTRFAVNCFNKGAWLVVLFGHVMFDSRSYAVGRSLFLWERVSAGDK